MIIVPSFIWRKIPVLDKSIFGGRKILYLGAWFGKRHRCVKVVIRPAMTRHGARKYFYSSFFLVHLVHYPLFIIPKLSCRVVKCLNFRSGESAVVDADVVNQTFEFLFTDSWLISADGKVR